VNKKEKKAEEEYKISEIIFIVFFVILVLDLFIRWINN